MRAILVLAVTAALLLPGAAHAFDVDTTSATNPDGTARFSDPDDEPPIPGLQVYGIESDAVESRGVYIPQSPASLDIPDCFIQPGVPLPQKQVSPHPG
jgi:hypothetical protein